MKFKRFWKILLIIAIVVVAFLLLGSQKPEMASEYKEYIVASGDTLWDISQEITPPSRDVRYTIAEIEEKNNINDGLIYPGQVISVPVYEEK